MPCFPQGPDNEFIKGYAYDKVLGLHQAALIITKALCLA